LLQPTKETPQKRFGLSWFLPAIKKHRTVLIEVFIASLFVQLLGLANPLITQVIIDNGKQRFGFYSDKFKIELPAASS
jgi:ABC-type bacteriocin/lantibiotic exporter with double-glycine peptidase domain